MAERTAELAVARNAVAHEIMRDRELRSIPIVAVTSYTMIGDRERVLAAGCMGYIENPIKPATFVSEIEQYLLAGQKGMRHRVKLDQIAHCGR